MRNTAKQKFVLNSIELSDLFAQITLYIKVTNTDKLTTYYQLHMTCDSKNKPFYTDHSLARVE